MKTVTTRTSSVNRYLPAKNITENEAERTRLVKHIDGMQHD